MTNTRMLKRAFFATSLIGLLFSPTAMAGPTIYVAAGSANKVIAIDAETNKVIKEFSGIDNPHALTVTPDGEYVIAGSLKENRDENKPNQKPESTIYIIHPVHGHVMSTMSAVGMIHHQAITPDGRYVISTHPTQGGISYADITGQNPVRTVKTGPGPNYTVVRKDGRSAYVSNSGNGTITEINLKKWTVIRNFTGGPSPEHLALSPTQDKLYALSARAGKITEIDLASGKTLRVWDIGIGAHGLGLSEDGHTLFATNRKQNRLLAIGLKSGKQKQMLLAPQPYHLEVLPGLGKVYVSSRKEPKIWVIDPMEWKVSAEINISGEGHQMVVGE